MKLVVMKQPFIFGIYIYIYTKLATIVESDPKAPFSIGTTSRYSGGSYFFPGIAPLYP